MQPVVYQYRSCVTNKVITTRWADKKEADSFYKDLEIKPWLVADGIQLDIFRNHYVLGE